MAPLTHVTIEPVVKPIRGRIRPPGSKSITNRALVCAALAKGSSTLTGALDSEDTRVMIDCLGRLGIPVESLDQGRTLAVAGCGGKIPAQEADLFVGNSGTTIRFLTAMCALGHGTYRLDGIERMRQRPIGDLLAALRQLGVHCPCELREGFPPVVVNGTGLRGGQARVKGTISSQFLSGLLLTGGASDGGDFQIIVEEELVSRPYIDMTMRVMEAFAVQVDMLDPYRFFEIQFDGGYQACRYAIEPDASAASYFWAAAAITGGEVTVEGLSQDSLQGDVKFVECLQQMGCRVTSDKDSITVAGRAQRGIEVDMNAISDTVQTLAPVALFAAGPTTIRGVGHIRHKETDRIGDLARELRKFGAAVDEFADGLRIIPPQGSGFKGQHSGIGRTASDREGEAPAEPPRTRGVSEAPAIQIETYNDHRMAMSLALAGLIIPNVTILNPGCTAKTYPHYFDDLARLVAS